MSSNQLDAAIKKTFPRSLTKYPDRKVPHGVVGESSSPMKEVPEEGLPSDLSNNQIPFTESASRFQGRVTNVYYEYLPLSQGISQGRVEAVKNFLNRRPDAVDKWITLYETPLLKACACGKLEIVKELLSRMTPEQMLPKMSQNDSYHTPLTVVAVSGNMEIAEALLAKNPNLLEIPGINGQIPVVVAVENTKKEMARYLYTRTLVRVLLDEDGYHGSLLFLNAIYYKMLDIALDLFSICRHLAYTKHLKIESVPIIVLASKPDLFPGGCYLGPLERFIYSWIQVKLPTLTEASRSKNDSLMGKLLKYLSKWTGIDEVYRMKVMHLQAKKLLLGISQETLAMGMKERSETVNEALLFAVRYGNVDFLVEMIKNNSELLWSTRTSSGGTLVLLAVEFRQEKVFSLLYYGLDDRKYLLLPDKDTEGNGVLHLASYPSPPSKLATVSGASSALQMQRELQWFKEVERIAPEIEKDRLNTEDQTPFEIFTKEHQSLRQEAEKWMKDTAMSCSFVAALIVTVTFAAVFTVPGGTDDNSKGKPFYLHDRRFITFIVSDSISCFAACTSVLIFLGILTARYSFDDFLVTLPKKMIAGLSTLFVSIAAMLIAFSSALFTILDVKWIVAPTILFACLPALLFVLLQYPLLKEMIFSTYGKGIFDRNMKIWS